MPSQHTVPTQWLECLEATDTLVVITNGHDEIEYGNGCFAHVFGCEETSFKGAFFEDLLRPLIRDDAERARVCSFSTCEPTASREEILLNTTDHPRWFAKVTNPVFDDAGNWIQSVHVLTDCTLIKIRETVQRQMMEAMASEMPISDIMLIACREFEFLAPNVGISILGVNEDGRLRTLAAPSLPSYFSQAVDGQLIGPMSGACGAAAFGGEPVLVNNIACDPRTADFKDLFHPLGIHSCWSSPIKGRNGRVIGTFAFYYRDANGPDAFHRSLVDIAVHICAIALENEATRARIHQLAYFDSLTGLPARQSVLTRLEHAISDAHEAQTSLAVLLLSFDRVREVNNLFGEGAGDELLCQMAKRLEQSVDHNGIVGRLAGDEFAVILENSYPDRVLATARKILNVISQPLQIRRGNTLHPTAAIGISTFPEHGHDSSTLMQGADLAMYQAKQGGRNRIRLFSQELVLEQRHRLLIEAAFREAISLNQLSLHYQPKVDLQGRLLWGVEALTRWEHPRMGNVPPASFIPIAEEYGLIVELGYWVLREACRQLASWRAKGIAIPTVAVNLSPTSLRDPQLPIVIDTTLKREGLAPGDLLIEITESIFMETTPDADAVMVALRELGVRLSIDDFGVGYSNLSRLLQLPVGEIKLDRSLIMNLETDEASQALVGAAVQLGKSLEIAVIAEGVEREAQRQVLVEKGCQHAQGYLFSHPLPADLLEEWARTRIPDVATRLH